MMGYGTGLGLGFGIGGWLMMLGGIAVVIGLVLVIAWAVGHSGASSTAVGTPTQTFAVPSTGQPAPDPVEILRVRLARGEITADEFAATKHALEAGR